MALLKCNYCGGMVSSSASICPHCGQPVNKNVMSEYLTPHTTTHEKIKGEKGLYVYNIRLK